MVKSCGRFRCCAQVLLFFLNYQIAFNFKACVLLKPNIQYFCNNSKIIAIWHPLFYVDIRTRFKLPFWIGALRKYFKRPICFLFFVAIKKRCHTIALHFISLTNNPYLGGGEGVSETPVYVKKHLILPQKQVQKLRKIYVSRVRHAKRAWVSGSVAIAPIKAVPIVINEERNVGSRVILWD